MPLYRPSELRTFIDSIDAKARKSLSQNFLIDGNILDKIVDAAAVKEGDLVVEIGPGPGALTEALLRQGAEVIAIEMDRLFAPALSRLPGKLRVFQADILDFPLQELLAKEGRKAKVVANLPYHISTPILQMLMPMHEELISLTLLVQKEFGARLVAAANTEDYSSLSLFAQYYTHPRHCFDVKASCFTPKPRVDSSVIQLLLKETEGDPVSFFAITRRAFQQRRKMLRSSLKELYSVDAIESALTQMGLSPQVRPEELSLAAFKQLASSLGSRGAQPAPRA